MVSDEQDETIDRIAAMLRPLPDVDASAKARVLVAVAAERQRDHERLARRSRRRPHVVRWTTGAALAAAGAFAAFMLRHERVLPDVGTRSAAMAATPASDSPAGVRSPVLVARDAGTALHQVQLVFRATSAHRVSVVGDFTGWDPTGTQMTRDPVSGLWSATLSLPAGRHVYAFLIDDTLLVRDPRAQAAPDADFGRPGSVLLVGGP
jgi:hypothetical protein